MSAGSIYRNENGVAVPYANIGDYGDKVTNDVTSLYTAPVSGIAISQVSQKTCGNVTILVFDFNITADTAVSQGNNTILTLGSYNSHKDLVPFNGGEVCDLFFMQSYLPVVAPCACKATVLYNGGVDLTMQSGGVTFPACAMQARAMFINKS